MWLLSMKAGGRRVNTGEWRELFKLQTSVGTGTNGYKWVTDKLRLEILRFPAVRRTRHQISSLDKEVKVKKKTSSKTELHCCLWRGGLWSQRLGLSDAEPPPSPLCFPFLPSDLFGSNSVQPYPCEAVAEEGLEKSLCTSQEHRKYPLKASSVNIPKAYICGCQQLSGPWMNELCAGPPFQAPLCSVGMAEWLHSCPCSTAKKESGFLAAEGFMTCACNFYLNPGNRAGLSLDSQENSSSGRWRSSSPSPFSLLAVSC